MMNTQNHAINNAVPVIESRTLWLEVLAVLSIGVLPDLYHALIILYYPQFSVIEQPMSYLISFLIIRSLTVTFPVLYIVWRNQEPLAGIGLRKIRIPKDIVYGIGLFVLTYIVMTASWFILPLVLPEFIIGAEFNMGEFVHRPEGWLEILLLLTGCILNGFAEEIVMRGYFIERLKHLLNSTVKGVLLSSFLFASYHAYQGVFNMILIFIMGIVFGIFYCRYRTVWPLAVAHTIQNMIVFLFMSG